MKIETIAEKLRSGEMVKCTHKRLKELHDVLTGIEYMKLQIVRGYIYLEK